MKRSRSKEPTLVVLVERRGGHIVGLRVSGHAGFAAAGKDIVCAAVSALVLAAAYGVRHHAGARVIVRDGAQADYRMSLSGGGAPAQAVLETAVSGLRAIARNYPNHVRIATARGQGP